LTLSVSLKHLMLITSFFFTVWKINKTWLF
jgi:hypothetical protein